MPSESSPAKMATTTSEQKENKPNINRFVHRFQPDDEVNVTSKSLPPLPLPINLNSFSCSLSNMAPGPPAPPPRTARQRIGTIQSYVTSFDKQIDKVIDGARLWQRDQKVIRDQEASEGGQQHDVDRVHAPRIAESLQRMLQQVGELPVLLGNKVSDAKSKAFESGSDPEEVESLGLALVSSYAPILNEKKVIIADLLTILTDYTVSYELNVSVPSSPEEILEEMERSFEESTLQEEEKEVSPPLVSKSPTPITSPPTHPITSPPNHPNQTPHPETTTTEENNSAHPQPHQIPETPILMNTGRNTHYQGINRAPENISDTYFNTNFRNPRVQQLFDNTTNYSNQQSHNATRYPFHTEHFRQQNHSVYRGNSQDARTMQNPSANLNHSRSHNNEYVSNQQRFLQNYARFVGESNQQQNSKINNNIETAIRQQRTSICELCEGRHLLAACTVSKEVLMRYCASTGRCTECTSLLHEYFNCPMRRKKHEDAEIRQKEKELELRFLMNSNSAENHSPTDSSTPKKAKSQQQQESFLPDPKKETNSSRDSNNRGERYMDSSISEGLFDHFRHCAPFSGDKTYYPKFRSLFNKMAIQGDTDLDIVRDTLLEKVTGKAAVHRSLVNDAKKAILITFQNLDRVYLDHVSVRSLVRELEKVRVVSDNSENFIRNLGVARQLYDQIHDADPLFFDHQATLSLLARMPFIVRQKCAAKRGNRTLTTEYIFPKAEALLGEMLADEELTGRCPENLRAKQRNMDGLNTHGLGSSD
ncbi:hypothetical protein GCK72_026285 [Caenorhabditis remanei]|uniref:Uncharacterized protein n=1 Tax=Caenorhabditis remanei TaxID=31234 RepID=A0A6A5G4F7_CAERE|nr:hypothetical protein GCK72_026285 [Caenorhabditis remanei]KAF1749816.1 hypothetical protein GCK72_026285 [Caenorhabditis remanei]